MPALRNRLTDLLLAALRSSDGEAALHFFAALCREAEERRSRSVAVAALPSSLLRPGAEGERILAEEPALLREEEGVLEIAPAFPESVPEITAKVRLFSAVVEQARVWRSSPAALRKAAVLWGAGLFFEFHEFLEELWRRERDPRTRLFLQGLIQIAVAFAHLEEGNVSGARRLLREGREKIQTAPPTFCDVDVLRLIEGVRACEERLAAVGKNEGERRWREWIPSFEIVSPAPCGPR